MQAKPTEEQRGIEEILESLSLTDTNDGEHGALMEKIDEIDKLFGPIRDKCTKLGTRKSLISAPAVSAINFIVPLVCAVINLSLMFLGYYVPECIEDS